jgi:hypothetical protein
VPFVASDGARNLNAICRELSIPYQTLRFRMNKLGEQGISVLPLLDVDKLGLQRIRASFEIPENAGNPKVILGGLHQKAGLKTYTRIFFSHEFDCEFMIPKGSLTEFGKLLRALEEMKLIENVEYKPILWKQVLMMRTRYFDYESGEWDIDYSRLVGDPSVSIPTQISPSTKFDYNDLLIIKSLELDPWAKVVDIAEKLKLPVGDVSYHLNKHVLGKKLIPSYRLRWIGNKESWSRHSIVIQTYVFEKLSDDQMRRAMSVMTAAPFTWDTQLADDGTYFANLLIPLSQFPETQHYISEKLRPINLRPRILGGDWSLASIFTIPYMMFEDGRWKLEAETTLGYVLQMISEYDKGK